MITLYQVINREDGLPCGPGKAGLYCECEDEAQSYRAKLVRITLQSENCYEVRPVEIDTLPARRVRVSGSEVGFQFARESMGSRSFRRTVTGIHQQEGRYVGEAEVMGQKIRVATDHIWFVWEYAE